MKTLYYNDVENFYIKQAYVQIHTEWRSFMINILLNYIPIQNSNHNYLFLCGHCFSVKTPLCLLERITLVLPLFKKERIVGKPFNNHKALIVNQIVECIL